LNYNFRLGDKIICSAEHFNGYIGKVIVVRSEDEIGVEFEKYIGGHTCDKVGEEGHCRWFYTTKIGNDVSVHEICNQSVSQLKLISKQMEFAF
jgi:hypothetical protein